MTPVEWGREATGEAAEAFAWYAARDPEVAERFDKALDAATNAISQDPERWPPHRYNTRRYVVREFPYLIFYRILPDRVFVLACMHGRRRPEYWRHRRP